MMRGKLLIFTVGYPLSVHPQLRTCRCTAPTDANGMDRPRSRPQQLSEWVGACQEQEHRHAEQVHRSRSRHHRN